MSLKVIVRLINKNDIFENDMGKAITRAVNRSAKTIEKNIKREATVSFKQRTGHLRRSISSEEIKYTRSGLGKEFGKAEVRINPVREGSDVNYGVFLEYGTKYIAPRAFIRKGAGKSIKEIKDIFNEETDKLKEKYKK